MTLFYRVEGDAGKSTVGLIKAVSLKHGISKLTALYSYDDGWRSHEVSTRIADHADELITAGYGGHKNG